MREEQILERAKMVLMAVVAVGALYTTNWCSCYCFRSPPKKASVSDLLWLLGTKSQASTLNSVLAKNLTSCLRFIVPFTPLSHTSPNSNNNELVWDPPQPVLDLSRVAFDSSGDPSSIHRCLDPTPITVPDVQHSKADRCQLTRTSYGRRFLNQELNSYLEFLFELITSRSHVIGLNVSLTRYDLFHGHLFISPDSKRLGILFHAKEYPAFTKDLFPINMGYCQKGSPVAYNDEMNLRNILWLAPLPDETNKNSWVAPGVLVVLDAYPKGIVYRDLIPEYAHYVRTLYEDDFGDVVVDINYLNVGSVEPDYQIFIC